MWEYYFDYAASIVFSCSGNEITFSNPFIGFPSAYRIHHRPLSHGYPCTYPSTRPKWDVVKVTSTKVPFTVVQESLWIKLEGILPDGRVSLCGPNIDENPRAFWNGVASHSATFTWAMRH
ncbi:hypothetical protein G4B88_014514 [Cannabis sativa]|uniref:Uncharacterized protein n=1 Tax=Cannabis sativa TaxID=3483 RepID=A0A7J6IAJ1_CANSA|nr:hypothetical protein G4B88_014514 [Cannabis sativa]